MPQQMLCAWLNGSPMLSAYCSQYHCVTLAGHVADGRPTTKRVTGWLTEYPCKKLWYEFEIDLDPLRSYGLWWNMRTWNYYYKTIELSLNDNMIYQMKKHLSKWIYSNQKGFNNLFDRH